MSLPVADSWFEAVPAGQGVMRIQEPHVDAWLRPNIWLVSGSKGDLLVDSGCGIGELRPFVESLAGVSGKPVGSVATHAHTDHAGGLFEFDERLCHPLEEQAVASSDDLAGLTGSQYPDDFRSKMSEEGWAIPDVLVTAVPREGFDPETFRIRRAAPTSTLEDGDLLEIGGRELRVVHLPGHTDGSIGLFEEHTGILFSGDMLFEYPVMLAEQEDIGAYMASMGRLQELNVRLVHGGHGDSFEGDAVTERIDGNIALCEAALA